MKNPWEEDWSDTSTETEIMPWEEDYSNTAPEEPQQGKPGAIQRIGEDWRESVRNMEANQARWENQKVGTLGRLAKAGYPIQQGGELVGVLGKMTAEPFAPMFEKVKELWQGEAISEENPLSGGYGAAKTAGPYEQPAYNAQTIQRLGDVVKTFKSEHPDIWATSKGLINLGAVWPVGKGAAVAAPEIVKGARIAVGAPIKAAGLASNKLLLGLTSEISGISKEALNLAATGPAEREILKQFAGKANEVGLRLLEMLKKPSEFLPEAKEINSALRDMPEISTENLKNTLLKSKIPNAIEPTAVSVNKKIGEIIENIPEKPTLSALEMRGIRDQLDIKIPWDNPEKNEYEKVLTAARKTIQEDLINAAKISGNERYVEAMDILSNKLEAIKRARDVFARGSTGSELNAESVMRNLFNKGKAERKDALKAVADIFGVDFVEQANLARLADEIGEGGVASWLPKHTTGKSLWAKGKTFPLGSPKIITRITLPATKKIEKLGSRIMGK